MEFDNATLLKSFVMETGEGLVLMEEALLELESHPDDAELVNTIFRVVHTFKGNAGIFELKHALEFAHGLEDLLDKIRNHQVTFSSEIADSVLASMDVLREFASAAAAGKDEPQPRSKELLQRIRKQAGTKRVAKPKARKAPDLETPAAEKVVNPIAETQPGAKPLVARAAVRTLRVDLQKLDRLLDLTGEIAIARGRTSRLLENKERISIEELAEAHSTEAMLQSELQELVMKVRMVPVGPLFRQFARTVRDLARELGKAANLQIMGEDIEVDTSVVDHLRDPLVHMIRNALDHGIEPPDQRRKAGKSETGTLIVRAEHQQGGICVEVEDDGAGMDRAKILEVAQKRGIAVDIARITDHEVYQLVFESGFSTAGAVSSLSGRGVGMDVVRRNVQALRGNVTISSHPGVGSTVQLRFPLTLAIIEGFAVDVGDNTYVIPLHSVVECIDFPEEERSSGGEGVINLRGEPLPYLDMGEHFVCKGERPVRRSIVVVRNDSQLAGLVVDELRGETQTVIKPLAKVFEDLRWASGSAILGNGRVALILDIAALLQEFCKKEEVEVA